MQYSIFTSNPKKTRAQLMAQKLLEQGSDTSPVQSPMQGLARVVQGAIGGYKQQKLDQQDANSVKALGEAMRLGTDQPAGLDPSTGIKWNQARPGDQNAMFAALLNNPDTADLGMQLQLNRMESKFGIQDAIDKEKALMPLEMDKARQMWGINSQTTPYQQFQMGQTGKEFDFKKSESDRDYGLKEKEFGLKQQEQDRKAASPYDGTSMDAQNANILLTGDPSTPQYKAAYLMMAQPKVSVDPATGAQTIVKPDMSAFRPPVGIAAPQGGQTVDYVPGTREKFTDSQATSATFADRMDAANANIDKFGSQGTNIEAAAASKVPGVGNFIVSPEYQQYEQSTRDFINAQLRRESGATIQPAEFESAKKQYFPQPGDRPEVIKQKAQNRAIAIQGMQRASGPSYKQAPKKIKVSNGKETLQIDAGDLAHAQADGYRQVP